MIVCPLCEHPQPQGDACDMCGRRLEVPAGELARVPPLDGLEPTRHVGVGGIAAPRLEGLEPTVLEPGDPDDSRLAGPEPFLDLEPTRTAPVEVEVSPVPEIEPTATALPGDAPTPLPVDMVCRYCRTPALAGERRCGRCGMRLAVVRAPGEGGAADARAVRRCSCGAPVTGAVCPACGGRVAGSLDG
jgi:hypothetical protein